MTFRLTGKTSWWKNSREIQEQDKDQRRVSDSAGQGHIHVREGARNQVEQTGWDQMLKGPVCWSYHFRYYPESNVETSQLLSTLCLLMKFYQQASGDKKQKMSSHKPLPILQGNALVQLWTRAPTHSFALGSLSLDCLLCLVPFVFDIVYQTLT